MGQLPAGEAEEFPEEDLRAEIPKPPAAKLPVDDEEPAPEIPVKPAAASSEPAPDEETQKFIAQSLTDVDLFASYGLTQKAMGLLEAILRRAPQHAPTLEKLLDFVLGAGDDRRTAELAAQLEQLHTERGDVASAERFGELRRRFQRAAGLSDEEMAVTAAAAQVPAKAPEAEPAPPALVDAAEAEPLPSPREKKPPSAPVAPRRPEAVARNVAPPVAETGLGADFLADLAHELDQLGISEPSPKAAAPASRPQASNSGKNSTKP